MPQAYPSAGGSESAPGAPPSARSRLSASSFSRRARETSRYTTAPATATARIPKTIHGTAEEPASDAGSLGVALGVAVGSAVSVGVGVVVALGVGVGVGVVDGVTVKANSPEIGCPSLETTFQSTVTAPDAAPSSGCVSTLSCAVGAPAVSVVP